MVRRYSQLAPTVNALLVLNVGMFLLELYNGGQLIDWLALWPLGSPEMTMFGQAAPHFQLWQWGSRAFTLYYFVCVIGAGLVQLFVTTQSAGETGFYPTIGASGGVFGLLLAFGLTFPNERLMLIFPPIVLRAKWFVLIYGAIELWAGVTGSETGVAHFAHLGGMLFGFLLLLYWRRNPPGYR
jgi:membrane associated rhomboid family serine protease